MRRYIFIGIASVLICLALFAVGVVAGLGLYYLGLFLGAVLG